MRGIVARTQTNAVANVVVFRIIIKSDIVVIFRFMNRMAVNRLMTRILVYSAIKISANIPLLYSTLNPETSSDSPSAKSKGVRFVSAKLVINHISDRGISMSLSQVSWVVEMNEKSKDFIRTSALRRRSLILTSYEIVWATPRKAPRSAYLELEHQPARKVQ